jgi:hypothetical protein
MLRRDFVKGVVAVPAVAHTVFGQQTPSQNSSRPPDVVPVNPPATPRQAPSPATSGRGLAGARNALLGLRQFILGDLAADTY